MNHQIVLRCIWPITDETVSYATLCRQAADDLPLLIGQASARLLKPGRFSIAPSVEVPGSGRVTESVLIYEAPAVPLARRSYRKAAA